MSEPYFLKLTLPGGEAVWINVAQITGIRREEGSSAAPPVEFNFDFEAKSPSDLAKRTNC